MDNTNKVPELRFGGFTEDWEKRELGAVAEFNPKHEIPDVFNYVDLESVVGTEMISYRKEYKISAPSRAQRLAEKGDVFYQTVRPYQKNNLLFIKDDKHFVFSTGYAQLRPTIESSFLFTLLQKDDFVRIVLNNCTGTSYPAINSTVLASIKQYFPKSKTEQKLIGKFFENIDKLITEHQQKHSKLKSLKKAMLDKMFPKEGQVVPEIRFKGFEGEWENIKLGMTFKITMGQSPAGINYTNNPNDAILVQGNADMKNGKVVPRAWTKQITKTADFGDIIFSVRAPVGEVGRTYFNVVIGRGVAAIKGNEFIFQILKKMNADDFWRKLSTGSTFDSINSSELSNTEILVPSDLEQIKIGNYFKSLDELIDKHNIQITKLQNIKKALLSKMFV